MYLEDRSHFNALSNLLINNTHNSSSACQNGGDINSPPTPPPPPSSGITHFGLAPMTTFARPRPILVDKQSSEPNTPVAKVFDRPMQRGDSDLSQRFIKKRVTLRHSLDTSCPSACGAMTNQTATQATTMSMISRCGSAGPYHTGHPEASPLPRTVHSDSSLGCVLMPTSMPSSPPLHPPPPLPSSSSTSSSEGPKMTIMSTIPAGTIVSGTSTISGHPMFGISTQSSSSSILIPSSTVGYGSSMLTRRGGGDNDSISTLMSSTDSVDPEMIMSEGSGSMGGSIVTTASSSVCASDQDLGAVGKYEYDFPMNIRYRSDQMNINQRSSLSSASSKSALSMNMMMMDNSSTAITSIPTPAATATIHPTTGTMITGNGGNASMMATGGSGLTSIIAQATTATTTHLPLPTVDHPSSSSSSSISTTFLPTLIPSTNLGSYDQLFQLSSVESLSRNDDSDCDTSIQTVIHKDTDSLFKYSSYTGSSTTSSSTASPTDNRASSASSPGSSFSSYRYHHPHHYHHVPHRRHRTHGDSSKMHGSGGGGGGGGTPKESENL